MNNLGFIKLPLYTASVCVLRHKDGQGYHNVHEDNLLPVVRSKEIFFFLADVSVLFNVSVCLSVCLCLSFYVYLSLSLFLFLCVSVYKPTLKNAMLQKTKTGTKGVCKHWLLSI